MLFLIKTHFILFTKKLDMLEFQNKARKEKKYNTKIYILYVQSQKSVLKFYLNIENKKNKIHTQPPTQTQADMYIE